jgi:general secretion pathway protein D
MSGEFFYLQKRAFSYKLTIRGITFPDSGGVYSDFYEAYIPVNEQIFGGGSTLNTLILPTRRLAKTLILVLLTSILMVTTALAEDAPKAGTGGKDKVVRQIVDNWIQIGTEQYKRGFYAAAEKSFMRAKDYEESLTAEERTKLNESLQMAHKAAVEQEAKQTVSEPAVQRPVNKPAVEQPKEQATVEVNNVAKPAPSVAVDTVPEVVVTTPAAQPEQEQGYIGVINQRTNIIRSRVKAVVNDSAAKAEGFIGQGQFDKAREAVEVADRVVYENQQQLGDYLFNQYSGQLKQLSERIADGQKKQAQQKEDEKRVKAEQSQQEHKEQMSAEREKRINDLFQNTLSFQKQQRYEEALGQLDMLLAIDPQNNQALILKQTLEDMVSFRKQLEIEKEKGKEKVNIMMKTDEAAIPYAEEMTHPKNWREIIAKPTRQSPPEDLVGEESTNANAAVEKQLDEIINLPSFSPEMQLREAINLIKNSVSPPINIVVNWGDLYNNANIDQTTPINMDPQTNVALHTALDLLLQSVSAGVARLGYDVRDGVVRVATQQSLPSRMTVKVYDVTILVGRPADYYVSAAQQGGGQGGGGGGGGGSGGGGGGGGSGNSTGGTYYEDFGETDTDIDRATLNTETLQRMTDLVTLIQNTVAPTSWYDAGGEATITAYENKKLVISQTPENHLEIVKLLLEMRKALGHQVSIEARFLVVGENFLEEIGIDSWGNLYSSSLGGTTQWTTQSSFDMAEPQATGITGSFDISKSPVQFPPGYPAAAPQSISQGALMSFTGVKFGGILDGLETNFLIRATQAHRDSETLVAPKVTVLSGESATLQVRQTIRSPGTPDISYNNYSVGGVGSTGGIGGGTSSVQNNIFYIPTGPTLNITPTITPDKKHVLLNISAELWDFLGYTTSLVDAPFPGNGTTAPVVLQYHVTLPQTERSRVRTRVSVPDGGTLLLGGLKQTAATETEVGVPVLSKIPIIGRLFTNRSKVADSKILLILVKPTIILQEEADAEAIAAMESQ